MHAIFADPPEKVARLEKQNQELQAEVKKGQSTADYRYASEMFLRTCDTKPELADSLGVRRRHACTCGRDKAWQHRFPSQQPDDTSAFPHRNSAEVELKPSTVASYAQLLRLYVLPRFGALQVTAIERGQVKAFLGEWSAKGELSRNTLRLMLCTLRVVLNHAVEDGVIDHNPAEKLGRFTKTIKPQHQAQAMTRNETEAFLASATE